ncbi:MAG: thermonuclease family protein [Pseudomonadota bacterium]
MIKRNNFIFITITICLLFSGALVASAYKVSKIIDGDTIECTDGNINFRVRLAGIDAPEKKTFWGRRAKMYLEELLQGKSVDIKQYLIGPYNRIIGDVLVGSENASYRILKDGYAEYYREGCIDYELQKNKKVYKYDILPYIKLEQEARAKKLNIWLSSDYVSPCKYRKQNKK